MIEIALGTILLGIGLWALALQRLYSVIPAKELKRLAGRGDQLATRLYRVAAYGASARLLLWVTVVLSLGGGASLLVRTMPPWATFTLLLTLVGLMTVVLPSLRLTQHSAAFAGFCASPLVWLLLHTHAGLDKIRLFTQKYRTIDYHSHIYEKDDLLHLLTMQKEQSGNRIVAHDLELAERALTFSDRPATNIVRSRATAYLVNADESIGPVLLDQLHQQRQQSFLVYKDKPENIVGSLSLSDAVKAKHGGRVLDLVKGDVVFVHEDFSLRDVLIAFQKTGQRAAAVINGFEEFVGVITLDDVLSELLGPDQDDANHTRELPVFENRSAVAAFTLQPQLVPEIADSEPPADPDPPRTPDETQAPEAI